MSIAFSVFARFGAKDETSKAFNRMTRTAKIFGDQSARSFKKANIGASQFKSVVGGILAAGALQKAGQGLTRVFSSFITEASKVEDATAAFTPLMGGVTKATQLVGELNKTAATTPFQFEGIASVAKQLLPVMNGSIEDTISTFRMLGDTAGGNIEKLETITRGYTKALLKGKPDMESMNMISEAGVPIFTELSKTMGITVAQLFDMSKAGKITNKDLTNAFKNMTKEGGIFFGGMEIASKTMTGMWSTFKDNVSLTVAMIGGKLAPTIKKIISIGTGFAQNIRTWVTANQDLIKTNIDKFLSNIKNTFNALKGPAIALFGSVKKLFSAFSNAANSMFPKFSDETLTLTNVLTKLMAGLKIIADIGAKAFKFIEWASPFLKPFLTTIIAITLATKAWAIAQAALNIVMSLNPIGLIIIGVASLVAGIVMLVQNWDKVTAALKRVWGWFSKLLDNPFIAAAATLFAPFITIPALIIKHWEPLMKFINSVLDKFSAIGSVALNFLGGENLAKARSQEQAEQREAPQRQPPNRVEVESRNRNEFSGQLNIAGAPAGSTFTPAKGRQAQIDVNMLGIAGGL